MPDNPSNMITNCTGLEALLCNYQDLNHLTIHTPGPGICTCPSGTVLEQVRDC